MIYKNIYYFVKNMLDRYFFYKTWDRIKRKELIMVFQKNCFENKSEKLIINKCPFKSGY